MSLTPSQIQAGQAAAQRIVRQTIKGHCQPLAERLAKELRLAGSSDPEEIRSILLDMLLESIPQIRDVHNRTAVGDFAPEQYELVFTEMAREIAFRTPA